MPLPDRRETAADECPRCGTAVTRRPTGRPAVWCSQRCRRAAYEERRAARAGAVGLQIVNRMRVERITETHALDDCLAAVLASPTASARALESITRKLLAEDARWDPRWHRTYESLLNVVDTVVLTVKRRR